MKILIITNNYPRKNALRNGIFIHQQVKALQQLGVECYVLLLHNWFPPFGIHKHHTYWQQGYDLKQDLLEEYEDVKIFAVPMVVRMPGRIFNDNYFERAAKTLIKFIKSNKTLNNADWLYGHFLTDNGYIAAKMRDTLGMKLAVIARGDDVHAWPEENPGLVAHLHYVFDHADLLLANSKRLADDTRQWMEPGKEREVAVAYNGVDHNKFRPAKTKDERLVTLKQYDLSPAKKYMVCIATPVVLKGWMELLEAIKECGEQLNGWMLLMVAPPRNNKDAIDLKKVSETLGITDRVLYIGEVVPEKLPDLLRAVDAFILPSYNEGMSNALLEAMASGLPCIATAVGGHREVIQSDNEALLIQPRSVDEIVKAITTITKNDHLRVTMGVKARQKMIAFGDYVYNAEKLLSMFNNTKKR